MEKMQTGRRSITTLPVHGHQNRLIYALTMLLIAKIIIFRLLGIRQGVIGSGTVPFPISFNHVLSGVAQFDSTVSNDDLWNADLALFISNSSIRCGGEGRRFYHIGIGY